MKMEVNSAVEVDSGQACTAVGEAGVDGPVCMEALATAGVAEAGAADAAVEIGRAHV